MTHYRGIILSKRIFGENHFVLAVLLENGIKKTFYCYGGMSYKKKAYLELGYCLDFSANYKNQISEINLVWRYEKIAKDYPISCQMVFYLKICEQFLMDEEQENEHFYRLLAAAIYELEESLGEKLQEQKVVFLSKFTFLLGFSLSRLNLPEPLIGIPQQKFSYYQKIKLPRNYESTFLNFFEEQLGVKFK